MSKKLDMGKWLKAGQYLPPPLRDFHDQKDVFKLMHNRINVEGHEYAKSVNWVAGQCYVIDIFLWFMARRGWTLQRSRTALEFNDLDAEVKEHSNMLTANFSQLLAARINADPRDPEHPGDDDEH